MKGKNGVRIDIFLVIGRKGVVYVLFILKINCWKLILIWCIKYNLGSDWEIYMGFYKMKFCLDI